MTTKDMLAEILRRGTLTERERESFTDMWDRIHRYNRCSDKQRAWIEKVYFGQKLDREVTQIRRRVVIPTWQRTEDRQTSPAVELAAPPVEAVVAPQLETSQLVKTNARQILLRRQNGAFRVASPSQESARGVRIGYINYPGVQRETLVTSLDAFESICPRIEPGSKQYQKVAGFFERGGVVLKVKPLEAREVA